MSGGAFTVTFTGQRERLQSLTYLEREQLPFAAALTLTRTAQEVEKGLVDEMSSVFDRPTRATLNSLFIQPATKQRMEASVWIKDGRSATASGGLVGREGAWGKGRAASSWLTPQVFGRARSEKGFEKLLARVGALDSGRYAVPGDDQPLDQYGNLGRGRLNKILSGARLFGEEGYKANATDSDRSTRKGNTRYFVIRKGRRPIGIAERLSRGKGSRNSIRMALVFVKQPTYSRAFDFFGVSERIAKDQLPVQFELAIAQALATRRR
ncbi:MAG: hypothetical protein KJ884_02085 [Gammaproteobacteria bacterium]|uniref:Tail protein n=1 Tax=viral metagenome TaxID=1070528 RepID=A0A6M3JAM0_9ZZZZ|nr:hypothetical protein [Gammaproteobacteria bacterium]MBU1492234.1 hypothetical protein [Gammaproteobacteria bacterium]MBU2066805.1 hypothetical protein [Gammaproteobacteria bacterium]MBU2137379.1 hypothetical protein [Gammaproteobacteria bacterium]MBU2215060.1 hypothetical protein [Gammaproteobacteria bacterium]